MAGHKSLTRREAIKLGGLTILSSALGSCAKKAPQYSGIYSRKFNPVIVSEQRVMREVAGLRPYRPQGFVVKRQKLGSKDVVHNYGHGGGGISLCWGTSHMAMEKAAKLGHRECAVLGCGIVGLTTATLMQRRGLRVTIYAKDLPPATTSNIAAGKWTPLIAFNKKTITPDFYQEFLKATRLSYDYYQEFIGKGYGVTWTQNYIFGDNPVGLSPSYDDLLYSYRDVEAVPRSEYPFDKPYCLAYTALRVETPLFMNALAQDFRRAGGKIVLREFMNVQELSYIKEPLIMNCTGLGSSALFGDRELVPVKGQLTMLMPQPEVDYSTAVRGAGLYMVPRTDGILLGGTWQKGEWNLTPDPVQSRRILEGHAAFFDSRYRLIG
jgi:glycine/D-amino acid oxidase-like deaminating enzyme